MHANDRATFYHCEYRFEPERGLINLSNLTTNSEPITPYQLYLPFGAVADMKLNNNVR